VPASFIHPSYFMCRQYNNPRLNSEVPSHLTELFLLVLAADMATVTTYPPLTQNGITTSWLPVTSAWPSVSQCLTEFYKYGAELAPKAAFDPFFGRYISSKITCLPPAVTLWRNQSTQIPPQSITSLGPLECPELYYTASSSVADARSTLIACCPS